MSIDWNEQWAFFAENFHEGRAHIDLTRFGGTGALLLNPGPGFGDLSHPTTYLMLHMLQHFVRGHSVVDIGTGSGILALAALRLGAIGALGVDIDPEAVAHAQENNALNELAAQFQLGPLNHPPLQSIFLMNMIFPEQKGVNPAQWNGAAKKWITSGILKEQRAIYLTQTALWGWSLEEEHERQGWLGFVFSV